MKNPILNLAIISTKKGEYSETFINQHIQKLPFNVTHYYGLFFPNQMGDSPSPLNKGLSKVFWRIVGYLIGNKRFDYHRALSRSFQQKEIDVILAEYGPNAIRVLPVARKMKIPLIVHFHGYDITIRKHLIQYDNYRELAEYVSAAIVVSKAMYKHALKIGFSEKIVHYNVTGPDPGFFALQPNYKRQQFICIGRFTEKKAPHHTLDAFRMICKDFQDAHLLMIGRGELFDECKSLTKQWDTNHQVDFCGVKTPAEVMNLLEDSLALVQHSVTAKNGNTEGTPVSVLEAQAAAIPVIATYHAGIPDIIVNDETGILVQEHDVQGMAYGMKRLLENSDLARSMGKKARQRMQEHFTLQRHLDELTSVIRNSVKSWPQ